MRKTIIKKILVPILISTLLVGTYGAWLPNESFVLYMTPTNSDQFIIVEDSASKLTTAQNLEQIYSSSLEEPSNDLLLCVGKAFKADEVTQEETKNKPNLLMAQPLKTTVWDFRNVMGAGVANARKVKNVYMDRGGQHFDAYWDLEYDPKHGAMKSADATITVKFTAYNTLDKEVKGPIIAYSTSSNPIVTKP
ncbi:hypothetical protein [Paenibacillus faecalis]|uniref:hypothetical protein n=1 Tax=Paenibacillus faecalis TaxID=2079532 RepID=UPI000D0E6EC2|nr:hypothetical protein [Paenibacillus faecalis]